MENDEFKRRIQALIGYEYKAHTYIRNASGVVVPSGGYGQTRRIVNLITDSQEDCVDDDNTVSSKRQHQKGKKKSPEVVARMKEAQRIRREKECELKKRKSDI